MTDRPVGKYMGRLYDRRLRRAKTCARLLSWLPFVRMVGLNGSMTAGKMNKGSDIDLYVATAPGRLFLARLLVVTVVQLTGWRLNGTREAGRICLNCYGTTESLDIRPHNEYCARVYSRLVPLWSDPGVYEQFCTANSWMATFGQVVRVAANYPLRSRLADRWRLFGERVLAGRLGDWLEGRQRQSQANRVAANPRSYILQTHVVVNDQEFSFHV